MKLNSFKFISSLLAFILWFSWTYYINSSSPNVLTSALFQGLYSALTTLLMIYMITYFYNLLPKKKIYFTVPSIITVAIATLLIVAIHITIHTYNITATVVPTIMVAFLFSLYTTKKLIQKDQNV